MVVLVGRKGGGWLWERRGMARHKNAAAVWRDHD
jgi:hypothetical protein